VERLEKAAELNATAIAEAGCVVEAKALPWGDAASVARALGSGEGESEEDGGSGSDPDSSSSNFPDIIIGADVLYCTTNFDALLQTLELLARPRLAPVYLATEQRWSKVSAAWEESLSRSLFYCVRADPLPTPKSLPRAVLLQELRLRSAAGETGQPVSCSGAVKS
jgi:hypothetical protein